MHDGQRGGLWEIERAIDVEVEAILGQVGKTVVVTCRGDQKIEGQNTGVQIKK